MRADVEVELAIVPGPAEPADGVMRFDDGDVLTLPGELVGEREAGDAGPDDGDSGHGADLRLPARGS